MNAKPLVNLPKHLENYVAKKLANGNGKTQDSADQSTSKLDKFVNATGANKTLIIEGKNFLSQNTRNSHMAIWLNMVEVAAYGLYFSKFLKFRKWFTKRNIYDYDVCRFSMIKACQKKPSMIKCRDRKI